MTSSPARKQRRAGRIAELEAALYAAQLESWSARKGLIAYMDEHGLAERVNKDVRALVASGPPIPPGSLGSTPNDQKG